MDKKCFLSSFQHLSNDPTIKKNLTPSVLSACPFPSHSVTVSLSSPRDRLQTSCKQTNTSARLEKSIAVEQKPVAFHEEYATSAECFLLPWKHWEAFGAWCEQNYFPYSHADLHLLNQKLLPGIQREQQLNLLASNRSEKFRVKHRHLLDPLTPDFKTMLLPSSCTKHLTALSGFVQLNIFSFSWQKKINICVNRSLWCFFCAYWHVTHDISPSWK